MGSLLNDIKNEKDAERQRDSQKTLQEAKVFLESSESEYYTLLSSIIIRKIKSLSSWKPLHVLKFFPYEYETFVCKITEHDFMSMKREENPQFLHIWSVPEAKLKVINNSGYSIAKANSELDALNSGIFNKFSDEVKELFSEKNIQIYMEKKIKINQIFFHNIEFLLVADASNYEQALSDKKIYEEVFSRVSQKNLSSAECDKRRMQMYHERKRLLDKPSSVRQGSGNKKLLVFGIIFLLVIFLVAYD